MVTLLNLGNSANALLNASTPIPSRVFRLLKSLFIRGGERKLLRAEAISAQLLRFPVFVGLLQINPHSVNGVGGKGVDRLLHLGCVVRSRRTQSRLSQCSYR